MSTRSHFDLCGLSAARHLFRAVGTQEQISATGQIGRGTIGRWMVVDEVTLNGRPWFGYPAPLPFLDQVCEQVLQKDFLDACCGHYRQDVHEVASRWRREGLRPSEVMTGNEMDEVLELLRASKYVSHLFHEGIPYPKSWAALDLLCASLQIDGWIELVLLHNPASRTPFKVPGHALREMARGMIL